MHGTDQWIPRSRAGNCQDSRRCPTHRLRRPPAKMQSSRAIPPRARLRQPPQPTFRLHPAAEGSPRRLEYPREHSPVTSRCWRVPLPSRIPDRPRLPRQRPWPRPRSSQRATEVLPPIHCGIISTDSFLEQPLLRLSFQAVPRRFHDIFRTPFVALNGEGSSTGSMPPAIHWFVRDGGTVPWRLGSMRLRIGWSRKATHPAPPIA